jgi:hypothetical protein
MEPAILTAATGLVGSLVGAASSIATTWLGQRGQLRTQWRTQEAARREELYAAFIAEVAKCLGDAVSHDPEGPEVLVNIYTAVGRMRLKSSRRVVGAAENLIRLVVDTYAGPNLTFADLREKLIMGQASDPLEEFGEACRTELEALRAY